MGVYNKDEINDRMQLVDQLAEERGLSCSYFPSDRNEASFGLNAVAKVRVSFQINPISIEKPRIGSDAKR